MKTIDINFRIILLTLTLILSYSCQQNEDNSKSPNKNHDNSNVGVFQGISLLGDSLFTKVDSQSQKEPIEKLKTAEEAYAENPTLDDLIWIGRREAYLGRYDLAISTFGEAISDFPKAYEPYRHRGHRYITTREFKKAINDLLKATVLMEGQPIQIELDGIPNSLNIPLSNVQFNVWYHLGLAHYLVGEFDSALEAYKACLEVSDNDDLKVATLDWYYMTLMKLGEIKAASNLLEQVHNDMKIIENNAYFKRILMYKGELDPTQMLETEEIENDQKLQYVTQGYGLGNYYLHLGDTAKAKTVFENVLESGYWAAFGYIASETELAKLKNE